MGRDDLDIVLRQLAGSSLSEDEVAAALDAALARAPAGALTLDDFRNALAGRDLAMAVDVPLAD